MQKINLVRGFGLILVFLFIVCLTISYIFTPNFVEKNIDDDGRIGEHVKTRIYIFQQQMFNVGVVLGVLGLLSLIFAKKILRAIIKNKTIFINILVLIVLLLFFFIVGEIIIRLFFAQQINLEYGHGPGGIKFMENVKYNSLGFRDVEHQNNNSAFKILIIGDSFTFGNGIEKLKDIYPQLLQTKLDKKYGSDKFEVITLAKGGYSTIDQIKALYSQGLQFDPDLIILGYYANDVEGASSRVGFEKIFFQHYTYPYEIGGWLYLHSYMYYFLESRTKNVVNKITKSSSFQDYIQHLYSNKNPSYTQHQKNMNIFIEITKKEQIPLIIVNIPIISDFSNYPFSFVDKYVENITKENKVDFINLRTSFSKHSPTKLVVSMMDNHMNELGHQITAEVLEEHISKNYLNKIK